MMIVNTFTEEIVKWLKLRCHRARLFYQFATGTHYIYRERVVLI
jgi:hypothetical protein